MPTLSPSTRFTYVGRPESRIPETGAVGLWLPLSVTRELGFQGVKMNEQLDEYFGISKQGSTVEGEIRAGVTTFLTMAYILFVNPSMLSLTGIPFDDALFATAVAAFIGCVVMGRWANLPFARAPGMGLNAYFTFTVVLYGVGVSWEVALAAVFVEGILFMILSLPQVGARSAMSITQSPEW